MAQTSYKVNTKESEFAYLSEDQTRTVISASGLEGGRENLPGIAYCHNVVPTERGIQSVNYKPLAAAIVGLTGKVVDVRVIYSLQRNQFYLAFCDDGAVYRLDPGFTFRIWVLVSPAAFPGVPSYDKDLRSEGRVNGVTYMYYPQFQVEPGSGNAVAYYYDDILEDFVAVEMDGTDWDSVLGIAGSSGYLIAFTALAMAWSSTLNPLDFVPSQVTGAGGGDVANIAGNIKFCVPNSLGVIFYTNANAVAATYTGNVQYPFKFREVADSKGGINHDRIAYEANSEPQFSFTKGGIQSVTSRSAETILPALTDFLTGRRIETLNTDTWEYTQEDLEGFVLLAKKVKYISSRYLIFSYGKYDAFLQELPIFTHAILWDTALEKPGKLLIDHVDIFEYTEAGVEASKNTVALIQEDGTTVLLNFATHFKDEDIDDAGVVVFGKLQASRTRHMTLLGVELETIGEAEISAECVDLSSLTGARDFEVTEGVSAPNSPAEAYRHYAFRKTADNHNVAVFGRFGINSFLVNYTINGRR